MKDLKHILYLIFLILCCLPLVQKWTHLIHVRPLAGAYYEPAKPVFNAANWFNGTFQSDYETYSNDKLGFHPGLVRLRNGFCYRVFHQINAQNIIAGKHDFFYEDDYFKAYYGKDYIGLSNIKIKVLQIKQLQDSLATLGKTLVVCLAPSKAAYYPEYIPDNCKGNITDSTNYQQYRKLLTSAGVNVIDFNQWFLSMKKSTPYPLYPQYGIHWSQYGLLKATDSLITYLEQKRDIKLSHIITDRYVLSNKMKFDDYDLGKTLNLAGPRLRTFKMCYPEWHWSSGKNIVHPQMLAIADSYFWGPFNLGLESNCFKGSFWYYNQTCYPESFDKETHPSDFNLHAILQKTDIIVIMTTQPGLKDFSWGFLNDVQTRQ